jgi:hypothetical protein
MTMVEKARSVTNCNMAELLQAFTDTMPNPMAFVGVTHMGLAQYERHMGGSHQIVKCHPLSL